jgi:hypothetical protein
MYSRGLSINTSNTLSLNLLVYYYISLLDQPQKVVGIKIYLCTNSQESLYVPLELCWVDKRSYKCRKANNPPRKKQLKSTEGKDPYNSTKETRSPKNS